MSGSIVSAWINGTTYNVKTDADLSETGDVETEGIRHSGGTLAKRTLIVATVEGIDLIANGTEKQTLRDDAKQKDQFPIGYEEEDGTVNNASGWINITARTTQEDTMSIVMIPDGEWDVTTP